MFQVGDKVVRVDNVLWGNKYAPPKGKVVVINAIISHCDQDGCIIDGYPSPHPTGAWRLAHFRKIQPCEPEFIELLERIKPKVNA